MKTKILFLLLAWLPMSVTLAQEPTDYRPFIEEGKVWKVAHYMNELLPDYWTENYYFEGDTVIADIHCVKMMHGDAISRFLLGEGTYTMTISAPGYKPVIINNISQQRILYKIRRLLLTHTTKLMRYT